MSQSLCCGFWCFLWLFLYFKIKSNLPLVSYRKAYETDNITMYSNDLVTVHAKKILKKLYTFIVYRPLITASEAQCLIFMKTSKYDSRHRAAWYKIAYATIEIEVSGSVKFLYDLQIYVSEFRSMGLFYVKYICIYNESI